MINTVLEKKKKTDHEIMKVSAKQAQSFLALVVVLWICWLQLSLLLNSKIGVIIGRLKWFTSHVIDESRWS